MVGAFNNWNTIQLTNKNSFPNDFDDIHNVFLDGIRENMVSLVQEVKYGDINASYLTIIGYLIAQCVSDDFALQQDTTLYG